MNIYTVAFFGHRYIYEILKVRDLLEGFILDFLEEKDYTVFLVGRNGEFDQLAASAVTTVRKVFRDDNSSLCLVLPYPTAEYLNNQEYFEDYYTEIEISSAAATSHPKSAINIRNREMVDRADLIICYIEEEKGGAWQTVKYAKEQGKEIINIAEFIRF